MRPATRSVFFLVALMATMLVVVGGGSAEAATVSARADGGPLVSYERTGGIAGVDDRVEVSGSGAVMVRHRDGAKHRTRLSARRLRALRRALTAAQFERPVTAGPTDCADCFLFRLRHGGHTLSFSQVAVPARLTGVLQILTALGDRY